MHYFAYENNADSLSKALTSGTKYLRDKFRKLTPLEYAMERRSYESAQLILEYMMKLDNIYPGMTEKEITELIKFSPTNLP